MPAFWNNLRIWKVPISLSGMVLFLIAGLICSNKVAAWDVLTSNLYLECQQRDSKVVDCGYRMLIPEPPLEIRARTGERNLPLTGRETYPWSLAVSAILFLVDTSDPARQNVVEINIRHIAELLEAIGPHHKTGLASFDKSLVIKSPIGANRDTILEATRTLRATGKTTELYRNVIKAIDTLGSIEADRKSIFLFSDGQAEDIAYYHQDVINAARKAHVIINSFGYPRSVSLSVALQSLRRLSEETGGIYIEADERYDLPEQFMQLPFENIDSGGRFSVDLQSVPEQLLRENPAIAITFETDIGDIEAVVPLIQPGSKLSPVVTAPPAPAGDAQPAYTVISTPAEPEEMDAWLGYGIPIILGILMILVIIILVVVFQEKGANKQNRTSTPAAFKPFAYLVVQDEKATRYPITNTIWRIGRTRDNELTLPDGSVSRRHAEIHRSSNGNFIIFDVESLNGLYVNGEKIKKKKLQEGDILEIGDIFLRFTLYSADYTLDEDTAIQHTRAPAVTG